MKPRTTLRLCASINAHQVAFPQIINDLGKSVTLHVGLSPEGTAETLGHLLAKPGEARHLYVCGPGPMLEATRNIAATSGWADGAVHFEYFKNTNTIDDSHGFTIDLARSAMTLDVPAGKSILNILRENGINMPSSCEQGACGTCRVGVIKGEVDHQDVYLNSTEKAANKSIMTCVSRAVSNRLILDI